jgi:Flp pilus assembly protein TadD
MGIATHLQAASGFAQSAESPAGAIAAALRSGNYQEALSMSKSALQKSPKNSQILVMEGMALSGLGEKDQALAAYNSALKISPNFIPALEGAAQIEYNEGNGHAAVLLNRLLVLRPNDPTGHAMLGVLDFKKGDCKAAVEHFQKSRSLVDSQPRERSAAALRFIRCQMSASRASAPMVAWPSASVSLKEISSRRTITGATF